ncbi:MAG: HAD family phosphatase [Treponema sp.]|nr:HAD family phosphatase [Candidatus Treponema equi]
MLYIFDMGGVVTTNANITNRLCDMLSITEDELTKFGCNPSIENIDDPSNLFTMCSNGEIDTKEFWELFSKRSGIKVSTDWFHWLFHPVLNEKTVRIIKALREAGNRVVCGTNTISAHYNNHCERGDYSYFDQTYTSCQMGVSKPSPEFWNIIMQAESKQPKECVFIDDKQINCDAAAALGIHAIQFTTAEKLADDLGVMI